MNSVTDMAQEVKDRGVSRGSPGSWLVSETLPTEETQDLNSLKSEVKGSREKIKF